MPVEPALILAVESERILVGACRHAIAALVLLRFALDNLYNLTRNDPHGRSIRRSQLQIGSVELPVQARAQAALSVQPMNAAGLKQFTASLSGSK